MTYDSRVVEYYLQNIPSGIRTNTFALEAMRQRCTDVALQCPALEANNLPGLRAKLRSTAPDAPRSVHRTPTLSSNLGTASPLPLNQVPGSPSTVTGTIDAERMRDSRKNRTPEEQKKAKQQDRDRKKAKRGGGGFG